MERMLPVRLSMVPSGGTQYVYWQNITFPSHKVVAVSATSCNDVVEFATVGGTMVAYYRLEKDATDSETIKQRGSYLDSNANENFSAVAWASVICQRYKPKKYIVAGGADGVIKLIRVARSGLEENKSLLGHEGDITDIQCSPFSTEHILSASKDGYIRLWNIKSGSCRVKFNVESHTPLSTTFCRMNRFMMLSSGVENSVKVWHFPQGMHVEEKTKKGKKKKDWMDRKGKAKDGTVNSRPVELDKDLSFDKIECVRSFDSFKLSKNGLAGLLQWKFYKGQGALDRKVPIYVLPINSIDCKFEATHSRVALGNEEGNIFVFDVFGCNAQLIATSSSQHSDKPIRQAAISPNGRLAFSVNDQGEVGIWYNNQFVNPAPPGTA